MIRPLSLLLPVALIAPVFAQKAELKVKPAEQAERFTITSTIQTNETRKTLINGEEPQQGGRGGRMGGGGGENTVSNEVVFDQSPASGNWRQYQKVSALEKRPGQDGEQRETKVEGGLTGKKLVLKTSDDGKVELLEGEGEKAKPLSPALARGVPGRVNLDGFLPGKEVAVGEEFDLGKTFLPTLRGIVHPVTVDRPADAAGGQGGRGQRGQGQGGDQGGGDQGGRGQRGQGGQGQGGPGGRQGGRGGMGGMNAGAAGTVVQLLAGGKLQVVASGKLVGIDEKDGQKIATVELKGKLTGKGSAEDLGLPAAGAFGGRGGRGGQGQGGQGGQPNANAGTNAVDASFDLTGKLLVNLTQQRIVQVDLNGDLNIARETSGTRPGQDGEDMKFESRSATKGKFQLQTRIEPSPAK